jgi:hypothetical protein
MICSFHSCEPDSGGAYWLLVLRILVIRVGETNRLETMPRYVNRIALSRLVILGLDKTLYRVNKLVLVLIQN